jgi:hypothetical protein
MRMQGVVRAVVTSWGGEFPKGLAPKATWWKWRRKATFFDDGNYSRQDYRHCSIPGQMRMEVLQTSDWSCRIEVEKGEERKGRGANLRRNRHLPFWKQ